MFQSQNLSLQQVLAPQLQQSLLILQAPNFIVDWANRTSTGKTTALRVGASAWGNPDERAGHTVLPSWDASRVWVERASGLLSGIPLFMDDTKRAKNSKMVSELLYTVAGGRGRGRGNTTSLAATCSWRTVLLSSGEAPATSFSPVLPNKMHRTRLSRWPVPSTSLELPRSPDSSVLSGQ